MHYDTAKRDHGLKHDPFKALMVPRPVGWISSVSEDGVCNLAPYSFFNAVSENPTYVVFASGGIKDSLRNIEQTGEFVCSLATWDLREHMNVSSAPVPPGVDEFPMAGLTAAASTMVRPPRVKESPAAFECKHWKTIQMPGAEPGDPGGFHVVFGRVVSVYVDDTYISDGMVNTGEMRPIARLGYMDYGVLTPETVFTINRPQVSEDGKVVKPSGEWDGVYR
ncbi:MAG: flavin reductase family protein [Gammaproteobacteria bacterium]|nr:flavin reductase family protein [Gammaproteobacteria bacterium]